MANGRLAQAKEELVRSIQQLPDYTEFFVLFYADDATQPSFQTDWLRARPSQVRVMVDWISTVSPGGGTHPFSSFQEVLALDPPPDVVYFLTDGQIDSMSAADIAYINQRRRPAIINTIAFNNQESQQLLERIAEQSGGVYRFIPARRLP